MDVKNTKTQKNTSKKNPTQVTQANSNKPKGFQAKKNQKFFSVKPPGVKRLRGKGNYYKAFDIDMRSASANLPDDKGMYTYLEKDSLITALDPMAGIYFAGDLPWNCICDMWLYFRTTNCSAVEKYGLPSTLVEQLHSWKQYNFYRNQLESLFCDFIKMDIVDDKPLFLCFIYPNGDEVHIRRLYGEEAKEKAPLKFLVVFIPLSSVKEWKSREFSSLIVEKTDKHNEITEKHQLICVAVGIPRENFVSKYKILKSNEIDSELNDLGSKIENIKIF